VVGVFMKNCGSHVKVEGKIEVREWAIPRQASSAQSLARHCPLLCLQFSSSKIHRKNAVYREGFP